MLLTGDNRVIVGPNRMRAAMEDPQNVVERIKRRMGDARIPAHVRRPRHHARVPLRADPQEASPGRREADRQDRQRRDHGSVLLQRRAAEGDAGRRPDRRASTSIDIINEPTAATLTYAWHCGELGATGGDKRQAAAGAGLRPGRRNVRRDGRPATRRPTSASWPPTATCNSAASTGTTGCWITWPRSSRPGTASISASRPQTVHMLRNDCDLAKLELTDAEKTQAHRAATRARR